MAEEKVAKTWANNTNYKRGDQRYHVDPLFHSDRSWMIRYLPDAVRS